MKYSSKKSRCGFTLAEVLSDNVSWIFTVGNNRAIDRFEFSSIYKILCIDPDGIPKDGSENCDDKKDICPFGYGIRADGKILTGARADEWLEKDLQKGKNKEEE